MATDQSKIASLEIDKMDMVLEQARAGH